MVGFRNVTVNRSSFFLYFSQRGVHVPSKKLEKRCTKFSKPGGQSANTRDTRVVCRFHIDSAKWLPDEVKANLRRCAKKHITNNGYLMLACQDSPSQYLNSQKCVGQIQALVDLAEHLPPIKVEKKPTKEEWFALNQTIKQREQYKLKLKWKNLKLKAKKNEERMKFDNT
eukprot:GHVN01005901.1.p1 GENE.GHVN01005901.1~~GHVN01005901.1.p1  ORF type:complete len:170 (+),score=13.14 GHVN01005901.1:44-553(+)